SHGIVRAVCGCMERIAPLRFAEKWDNVKSAHTRPRANRILLTIDRDSVTNGINDWLAEGCSIYVQDGNKKIYASQTSIIGETFENGLGGQGRMVTYAAPVSVKKVESMVKFWLKLDQIQVAYPPGLDPEEKNITTVALGAGSAGSLVASSNANVWVTGEMSHHEVLPRCIRARGHTNTERGYLPDGEAAVDPAMAQTLEGLEVVISEKDNIHWIHYTELLFNTLYTSYPTKRYAVGTAVSSSSSTSTLNHPPPPPPPPPPSSHIDPYAYNAPPHAQS
ncbi:GTP cyclohydrolase 1 type 2/Nif3, partial [Irpex lacteus]